MNTSETYHSFLTALAVAYEANISTLIWGQPGEGKSSVVADFAQTRGIYSEVVVASLRDPTDLNGLPVTQPDGSVRFAPPGWLTRSNDSDGSLIVFDEINLAPPATRGACLRVINERVSADTPLNSTTRIVAIANPPETAEDGWELGAPMSNRFLHLRDWELPSETFGAGLTTGSWTRPPALTINSDDLAGQLADARAAVAAFVRNDAGMLRQLPDHPSERQYPWPSPRSWTLCATLVGYARAAQADGKPLDDEVIGLLVEGTVGTVAAAPFLSFLEALDLPDPAELLADPAAWQVPDRGDLTWAVLSRLLSHVLASGEAAGEEQWRAAGQVIAHAAESQGDVAVAVATDWWTHARAFGPAVLPAELANGRFANIFALTQENE
jgi:hypothetical protein